MNTKYKKLLLLLFFSVSCSLFTAFAQNKIVDSLNLALSKATQDTTRLRIYKLICENCDTGDNLKYGTAAAAFADKLLLKQKSEAERKNILKYKTIYYGCIQIYYAEKNDTSKMLEYGRKSISIFREIKDTQSVVNVFRDFQDYYMRVGNYPAAVEYNRQGLALSREMNYKKGIAYFLMKIGSMSGEQGEHTFALDNFQKALVIRTELKDTIGMANSMLRIANTYGTGLHNIPKAIEFYNNAILLHEKKKSRDDVFYVYDQKGRMYEANNDLPDALLSYQKSLAITIEQHNKFWTIGELCNVGQVYTKQGLIDSALDYHYKALKLAEGIKYDYTISVVCGNLAFDYLKQKNCKKAQEYGYRCLTLMKRSEFLNEIVSRELLVSQIDSACGNGTGAYEHYKQYIIIRDKLKNGEVLKAATKEKYQSEYDKQKAIDKKEQEKKDAITKAESKKQKLIILFVALGLLFVLVFAGFVFRSLRIRNKQNRIIVEQKTLVEEHQKEILDSISYAQRIQEAILPPLSEVISALPNSFILYKPKDIVSGDFYWFHNSAENGERRAERSQELGERRAEKRTESEERRAENGERRTPNSILRSPNSGNSILRSPNSGLILIAACDCTGHGVPGAFMSTIASEKLNEAVGNSTDVSAILQSVNIRMKKVLRQTDKEDSTHDGMDIALISFNKERTELEYAGANRPMWIVRSQENGERRTEESSSTLPTTDSALRSPNSELFETKATKTAIGGFTTDEQEFTKHKIQLNKGDTIYIFTDGFADQFSPENKKLMSKRFKEMLISINNKSMEEQKKYLDEFIEKWKGDMEQTDDILVIGVRV